MKSLLLILAMVAPKPKPHAQKPLSNFFMQVDQNGEPLTVEGQLSCYRDPFCDKMVPQLPLAVTELPWRPVMRPKPVIEISIDQAHEFSARANCPDGWTVDETDLSQPGPWTTSQMKAVLAMLVCRKNTHADELEEQFWRCRGFDKFVRTQVMMHWSGPGWDGTK
jgi:hypothetical protein